MSAGAAGAALEPSDAELRELDRRVERALLDGDEGSLPVVGFGEISLVLGWPPERPAWACKRLPPFDTRTHLEEYGRTLAAYVEALGDEGIDVVETELRAVELQRGGVAGYVVQPMLPAELLAPRVLAGSDPAHGHELVEAVTETAARTVTPRLGLDAQLANWVWRDGRLVYIDVSTPFMWSADGRSLLDLDLIAQAFPGILRAPLKRFVAPGILNTYRDLRKVYFDLCGNLLKERLDPWLPAFLAAANRHLEEPIAAEQVHRYYSFDKRLWTALLAIRRLDRAWRRRVRHRPYPFLLPKKPRR